MFPTEWEVKYTTYLALADIVTSSLLANIKVVGPRSRKNDKGNAVTWAAQAGNFETKEKEEVDDAGLPQFTTNWSFTSKIQPI